MARVDGQVTGGNAVGTMRAGRWLLRIGSVLFVIGLAFVVVVFAVFFAGNDHQPAAPAVATMLAPLGFALVLIGLFRQARAGNRARRAADQA
jgi:tellurite resistance protein TehA-like permease